MDAILQQVSEAQKLFAKFSQEQVDAIFESVAMAACMARIPLAKIAIEETGMGVMEDKIIKNHLASENVFAQFRSEKTCGLVSSENGTNIYADPIGVLASVVPPSAPTSLVIFHALLALKTRNAVVFVAHPAAKKSTTEAALLCQKAAVLAGAPKDVIAVVDNKEEVIAHPLVSLVLAGGCGKAMESVHAGPHPAITIGPGNCPALIDETANVKVAVSSIIISKTFDNGLLCQSESAVLVHEKVFNAVKAEFKARGCHFVDAAEKAELAQCFTDCCKCSGKKASQLSSKPIPVETPLLLAEINEISCQEPWSQAKPFPALGLLKVESFDAGLAISRKAVNLGGLGHSMALYTAEACGERSAKVKSLFPASRIVTNAPVTQSALADLSEELSPKKLLTFRKVVESKGLVLQTPGRIYMDAGCLKNALITELRNKKRVFVVTDEPLYKLGMADKVTVPLNSVGVLTEVFYKVECDPSFEDVAAGLERVRTFQPDAIVAIGGGSPMDAAKIMWLYYEFPNYEGKIDKLCARFMDVSKRVFALPKPEVKKCEMICIPTTSGTGSEVTPFSVITNKKVGLKYPIADFVLLPDIAISDAELVMTMPRGMVAATGIDVLTHAIEAYVSTIATPLTSGYAVRAIPKVFNFLEKSYTSADREARIAVHEAATLAGIAFANAFLGICHSCAHKIGAAFHIPHGIANALMLPYVIYYNASDAPSKMWAAGSYPVPLAKRRYAEIAALVGLKFNNDDEAVMALIAAIEDLKRKVNVAPSIQAWGVKEEDFLAKVDELALNAFDDQCTGCNPRFPLVSELKTVLLDAYYGTLSKGETKGCKIRRDLSSSNLSM